MKLALSLAAFASLSTQALGAVHYPSPTDKYDYSASLSGTKRCAVISVVMDESGSMGGEQAFIKPAVSNIVDAIKADTKKKLDHVFVCTYGYGSYMHKDSSGLTQPQHWHGCTENYDESIFDYHADGSHEDSFAAIEESIEDLPKEINGHDLVSTCGSLAKNMILVTDEDRDHSTGTAHVTMETAYTKAISNGWVVNIICNCRVKAGSTSYIGGTSDGKGGVTLFQKSGTGYVEVTKSGVLKDYVPSGADNSEHDYPPVAEQTKGAIWDIEILRTDQSTFEKAFQDIKVAEILDPPVVVTNAPTTYRIVTGVITGDPHVKLWNGEMFDFHGGCDLVVASVPDFANGLGLDVHIRTVIRTWWSYIDTAVLRIGSDTFEVKGGKNTATYWVNGVEGTLGANGFLQETIGGFKVHYKNSSKKQKDFRLDLGNGDMITFQTFNEFVRVDIKAGEQSKYEGAVGLMGEFPTGKMVDREGHVIKDHIEFGKEWQVRATEPKLFHNIEGVQAPEECRMPDFTEARKKRRLGEVMITEEEAHLACARVNPEDHDLCVSDVLATNDKEMAGAY